MRAFDIKDVMARLPSLIEQAARGDAFEIPENGVPLVRVVPSPADAPHDRLGFFAGEMLVPDDFDTMDRDRIEAWFGMSD